MLSISQKNHEKIHHLNILEIKDIAMNSCSHWKEIGTGRSDQGVPWDHCENGMSLQKKHIMIVILNYGSLTVI